MICNLDSFNGFEGKYFCLKNSRIKKPCKNVLHLNSIIATFNQVNMDYEHFFLTTDAPNMRKLEISNHPKLKDKDLFFLSGFYNLESISITGNVSNYEQVKKLEKLRKIDNLFCLDEIELERAKENRKDSFEKLPLEKRRIYLISQRMVIQNQYQEFFHKIYVPRLERVKWQDKISSYDLEQIKLELKSVASMTRKERKQIASEPKKEDNMFDDLNGLNFDKKPKEEDEYYLINSKPFERGGIDYYVLKRNIRIE